MFFWPYKDIEAPHVWVIHFLFETCPDTDLIQNIYFSYVLSRRKYERDMQTVPDGSFGFRDLQNKKVQLIQKVLKLMLSFPPGLHDEIDYYVY